MPGVRDRRLLESATAHASGEPEGPCHLLNWAVRYLPIIRVLKRTLTPGELVLEVGSGPFGLGSFFPYPYVGCDVTFPVTPLKPMMPVQCSGSQLPFKDASFPAVVASEVLEHVPPEQRRAVIEEALRVAQKVAVFSFPFGPRARLLDERFYAELKRRHFPRPEWLEEHMLYPFPDTALFNDLGDAWLVKSFGNAHVWFQDWVIRREFSRFWGRVFAILMRRVPGPLEFLLKFADREPFYRLIFVVTRRLPEGIE